jgi:MFS family permease
MEKTKLWTKNFFIDTIINFLLYLIYYLLMVIITVVAKDTLQASLSEAGLASGIFIVGTLFARLFVGKSIELFGRKKMLYAGIIFYLVTMLFYFDIKSLLILYIIRFLNGVGYGIASTATSTIIANIIPSTRRGEGINYYGLSTSVAAAVGPFLGMFLDRYMNFTFIVMFCVALLLICLVASLFLDVTEMKLSKEELAKLSRFSLDNFLEANVFPIAFIGLFMGFCYSSVLSFLAAYAKEINLVAAGTFFFVAYAVVITISRPLTGIIFDTKGENFVMYPCYICLAIGLFLLSQAHYGYVLLLAGVFVGLGYGTFMSNGQAICVKLSPYYRMGVATSTYFIALDLGLGVGPFLLGFLRPVIGFQGIYNVTAIVAFLCVFLYYALYGKKVGRMNCTTANCKTHLSGNER